MTDVIERPGRRGYNGVGLSPTEGSDPACTARRHLTDSAWRRHGCRCPEAAVAHRQWLDRSRERHIETHPARRARRRVGRDPREPWRGRHCRVDVMVVDFLAAGYRFAGVPPTPREYQVAVWRLTAAGRSEAEIATVLDISVRTVARYRQDRRLLRAQRAERRAADAAWRARHKHGQR